MDAPDCPLCKARRRQVETLTNGWFFCASCARCFQCDAAGKVIASTTTTTTSRPLVDYGEQ